jgi:hypothetical protein
MVVGTAPAFAKGSRAPVPVEARTTLRTLAEAADNGELATIRAAMVHAFTWSFGGDRDADQAITEWKTSPRYLRELGRVLRGRCRARNADHVECPGQGCASFRAGLVKNESTWKLEFFGEDTERPRHLMNQPASAG